VNEVRELAIIGGGPAGYTSAIYSIRGRVDFVFFADGVAGGQIATTDTLENYPGVPGPITGMEFSQRLVEQADGLGIEVEQAHIEKLQDRGQFFLLTDDYDEVHRARVVILATGAHYRPFPLEGAESFAGRGLSYCATCDGNFFRDQEVAVVGGGDTALEEALYLTRMCRTVHIVHRRTEFRGVPVLQWRVRAATNIQLHLPFVPEKIKGSDGVEGLEIKNVQTGEVETLAVTGVFSALGMVPNSELVKGVCRLDPGGYVVVNERMFTSHPCILAAGDVTATPLRQVAVAVGHGAIAAESARCWLDENCALPAGGGE
jgi:thioredoxin reductase (NADPH)